MTMAQYIVRVKGTLDDSTILRQIRAIEKKGIHLNVAGANGTTGTGRSGKGGRGRSSGTIIGDLDKENKRLKRNTREFKTNEQAVMGATKTKKKFGSTTVDITKKVAQFGAVTAVIRGVTDGVTDMVTNVYELDKSLTEFKKVSNLSTKELEKFTDEAYNAGRATARTGTEMVDAATQFKKMGYTEEQALQLAKTATMFQNIADTEIDAGQAALFINSQLKAFNPELKKLGDTGTQSMHVIDAVNEVANNFGVGTNDLQLALTKTSSAMSGFGNSFEETIGIITAGTEVMVGQPAKVARGWRTIGANIAKVAESAEKYEAANGKVSISMRNSNGELKSTYEFLGDLSKEWGNLTNEEKQQIGVQLAGKNHLEVFRATMDNFSTAVKATTKAQKAQGSATKENARYMESMEGKLQNLKSAWEKLSYKLINSNDLKKAIDGLTKALDFLSSDKGMKFLNFIKVLALGLGALKIANSVAGWLSTFRSAVSGVGGALIDASPLLSGFASLFGPAGWGVLISGVLVGSLVALNEALETDKYEETTQKLKELQDTIADYQAEYDELNEKRKSGADLTKGEQQRLDFLKQQLEILKQQEEVYKKLQHEQFHDKAMNPDKKDTGRERGAKSVTKGASPGGGGGDTNQQITATNALTSKLKEYNDVANQCSQIQKKMVEAQQELNAARRQGDTEGEAKALEKLAKYNEEYEETTKQLSPTIKDLKKEMKSWIDEAGSFEDMDEDMQKAYKSAEKVVKAYDRLSKTSKEIGDKPLSEAFNPEEMQQFTKDLTTMGVTFGIVKNKAGEVENIDFSKFDASLQEAGYSSDQVREALHQITNENPEATVTIAGTEVAQKDVDTVLDYLDALDSNDPEATVNVDGTEVAVKDIGNLDHLLTLLDGSDYTTNVKAEGIDDANKKVGEFEDNVNNMPLQHNTDITTSGAEKSQKQADGVSSSVNGIAKRRNTTITTSGADKAKKKAEGVSGAVYSVPKSRNVVFSVRASISAAAQRLMGKLGFAKGTRHAPEGLAEVNEEGFEFIRDARTGKLRIAGGGKRTVTRLNKGDIVYTHRQSKRMLSDKGDIFIPNHSKGKNNKDSNKKATKKAQEKYDKKRDKLESDYDNQKAKTESNAKIKHWTDAQLVKHQEEDYKKYKSKVLSLNQKTEAENKKNKTNVKVKAPSAEYKREVKEARADVNHDKAVNKIESKIDALSKSGVTSYNSKYYTNARDAINEAKKNKYISDAEKKKYLDEIKGIIISNRSEIAKRKIDKWFDLYKEDKKSKKAVINLINEMHSKGYITGAEQKDYIRELNTLAKERKSENEKDKIEAAIEKAIDDYENYGASKTSAINIVKKYFKNKKITAKEKQAYLKQINEIAKQKASDSMKEKIENAIDAIETGGSYDDAVALIEKAYKEKKITTDERKSYLSSAKSAKSSYESDMAESSGDDDTDFGDDFGDDDYGGGGDYGGGSDSEDDAKDALKKEIEKAISGVRGTDTDLAQVKAKVDSAFSSGSLTSEEYSQYTNEIYKKNLDYNMKLFNANKKTYKDMRATLEEYYKDGRLTAAEYYDYLESLMQEQLSKQAKAVEKMQTNNSNAYSLAQAYVNKQIKALQENNEELDKQNQLIELQANLEKAKNEKVRVYREGVGFVYEQNTEAVKEATKALQDFHKEEKSPELQKWEAISNLFGELEQDAALKELEVKLGSTASSLVGGLGTDINKWTAWIKNNLATGLGYSQILDAMGELTTIEDIDNFLSGANDTLSQSYINSMINKNRFASGTLSARGGLARVAENGYEIALLGKGDAVMPHGVSKNLMDWGQYSPKDFINQSGDTIQQYSFDKLVLPNVENTHDFIRELQLLPNKAIQYRTSRGY